jgi:hypothetical protein
MKYNEDMSPLRRLLRARFRLWKLFALMALVGLVLGWVASARQQQADIARMRASNPGAVLLYEHELSPDGRLAPRQRSKPPLTERQRLKLDYVSSIAGADLFYPTDTDIERLAAFPKLRRLVLERSVDLTDTGMARIARMKRLRFLVLSEADQVTDEGLLQLASLHELKELRLAPGRRITPSGIEQLRERLPNCRITVRANHETLVSN